MGNESREAAMTAVKKLEEKYRTLIMVSSEVIFYMSPDWSTMTELYGRGLLADTDRPDPDWREKYIHPQDRAIVDKVIDEALRTKSHFEYEHRVLKADGGTGWIYTRAVPLYGENGDITEWFGAASDITPRKLQEEALRESESRYIDEKDKNLEEIRSLEKTESGFRRREEEFRELTKVSLVDVFHMSPDWSVMTGIYGHGITADKRKPDPDWRDKYVHPLDRSYVEAKINEAVEAKSVLELEYRTPRADGSVGWTYTRAVPVLNDKGNIEKWTGSAKDITEYKRTKDQLMLQVQLLESVNEAILALDNNLTVIYWNKVAEKISGWSSEEIIGKNASNEFFNTAGMSAWEEIARKMETDHFYTGEITARRKDGRLINIDIHIRGIVGKKGERKSSVASFRDITERINTEKQLISSKQKIELLASIPRRLLESANPQRIIDDLCKETMKDLGCDVFFNYFVESRKRRIHLNAYAGVPEDVAKSVEWLRYGDAVCGCVAQEGKRIVAECINEAPDARTEMIAALGIKAYACHPLKTGGKVIGTLAFGTYKRKTFTKGQLEFMSTVSDYIAIAMGCLLENRKLKDSKRRAMRLVVQLGALKDELTDEVDALNTLYKLNSNFIIQHDLNTIYKEILGAAVSLTSAAKGAIQIFNEPEGRLELIMGLNFSDGFISRLKYMDLETGNCGRACKERKRIIDEDVSVTFAGKPGLQYLLDEGVTGIQSTPLISSSGRMAGVLNTYYAEKKEFKERELRMLDMLARLTADTIERTMTEKALKNSEKKAIALVRKLEEADRNKNRFINVLSHELRNPLATIMAGVSLLGVTNDAGQAAQVKEIMKRQSAQLCRLVDDLLDVVRINRNKIRLKKQRMDLNKVIREASEDFKLRFLQKEVGLCISAEGDPLYIEADAARITQAVTNLLHNSLKFTEEGGSVGISACRDNDTAVISVKDSGAGIKKEMLQRLFQPFVQEDESSGSGLGLGLSITKGITELHGGSISACSEGVGKGSEFVIRLPIALSEEAEEDVRCSAQRPARSLCILVIEDNREFAELLCAMLREAGHKTAAAYNGAAGYKAAKSIKPDIVLCDIGLPGMDGYEVAKLIRKNKRLKGVKLVALTGYATPLDISRSRQAGFDRHVAKPVTIEMLSSAISQLS